MDAHGGSDVLNAIVGLLPLAAGLVVFGAAVWFLLGKDAGLGYWLLAAFLIGHGLVQLMFLFPASSDATATANGVANPFDMAKSWLVTGVGLDAGAVRQIGTVLIALVVIGFGLAGLATVGLLVPAGWWQPLVVGSTAASLVLLVVFFSPGLILGVAIDAVLLWLVLASIWAPGVAKAATG